jgi:hypothetical protein
MKCLVATTGGQQTIFDGSWSFVKRFVFVCFFITDADVVADVDADVVVWFPQRPPHPPSVSLSHTHTLHKEHGKRPR